MKHWNVKDEGSLVMFEPLSTKAKKWWADNIPDTCTKMGNYYVVEARYAVAIAQGILEHYEGEELCI